MGNKIWIEPDWNVKYKLYRTLKNPVGIWIEPDWNVKMRVYLTAFLDIRFEYNQIGM